MPDFNPSKFKKDKNVKDTEKAFIKAIDNVNLADHAKQKPRNYLGGSMLGGECLRQLQYTYYHTPKDEGMGFPAKILRTFQLGHVIEDLMVKWIKNIPECQLLTETNSGNQFSYVAAGGKMKGHVDGIFAKFFDMPSPMLWECKSMNNKAFEHCQKHGVAKSKPVYAAQMAMYQGYMNKNIPGICENMAVFSYFNKDTSEIGCELVPFDIELAQKTSDKGVQIIKASESGEVLPRITKDPEFWQCRFCDYKQTCWSE